MTAVHPQEYVDAIRGAAEAGGGALDADTIMSAGSYRAAMHAAGGACAMVEELLAGRAPFAFCGMRPPGHHAERATAMGFCLFNNVAIAAQHALESGAERVLVLDWDVHHGNGTNDIFHTRDDVLFASIHQSPLYPGTGPLSDVGSGPGEGFSLNLPVPPGSGGDTFLSLVQHVVAPAAREFRPQLVLVSAGYDAHREDPLASCELEDGSYAALGGMRARARRRAVGAGRRRARGRLRARRARPLGGRDDRGARRRRRPRPRSSRIRSPRARPSTSAAGGRSRREAG